MVSARALSRKWRVVFFGSDSFSLPSLQALTSLQSPSDSHPALIDTLDVVCAGDARVGRKRVITPCTVANWIQSQTSSPIQGSLFKVPAGTRRLSTWSSPPPALAPEGQGYDFGIAVSFGWMIPKSWLRACDQGTLNVHPSDLPEFRGSAPLHHTLLEGRSSSALCVIGLSPGAFDQGLIYSRTPFDIGPNETYSQLHARTAALGAEALTNVLRNWDESSANAVPQGPSANALEARKIVKNVEGDLPWTTASSADEIYNRWRALGDNYGVWSWYSNPLGKKIKVKFLSLDPPQSPGFDLGQGIPGSLLQDPSGNGTLWLLGPDCRVMRVASLQPESRPVMTPSGFAAGYMSTGVLIPQEC